MFFGGNKNISKKFGAFILAFLFAFGLFVNFNEVYSQNAVRDNCTDSNGNFFNGPDCELDKDTYENMQSAWEGQENVEETMAEDMKKEEAIKEAEIEKLKSNFTRASTKIDDLRLMRDRCFPNGVKDPNETDCLSEDNLSLQFENARKILYEEEVKLKKSQDKTTGKGGSGPCPTFDFSCQFTEAITGLFGEFTNMITEGVGILLRLSGVLLNTTVIVTIESMSNFISGSNGEAVKISWSIIRDLINILFIFGLLYISISTIVKGISPKTKNLLVSIIASALLINFSFFFTSVLIDASNFLSVEIRNMIGECAVNEGDGVISNTLAGIDSGISNCIMSGLKIQTVFDPDNEEGIANAVNPTDGLGNNILSILVSVFFASVFIIITAFVFFALAIMLIIRFVMLIFLLITSPAMFLGWVLPNFAGISKSWFKSLTDQLLFPPFVFLFIFITLTITKSINLVGSGIFGIIINYLVIIGFMIASIMIAKKLGATGADWATAKAGNLAIGATAKAGRNTVGKWASRKAENIKGNSVGARAARATLKNVGNSTFDARKTAAFSGVGKATGVNFGEGRKDGYTKLEENRVKERQKTLEDVGKPTRNEAIEIDKAKMDLEKNDVYQNSTAKIKGYNEEINDAKERMKEHKNNKNGTQYKNAQNMVEEKERMIEAEKQKIDATEPQKIINEHKRRAENRIEKEKEKMTNSWFRGKTDSSQREAARKYREDQRKNAKKTDSDKFNDSLKKELAKLKKELKDDK